MTSGAAACYARTIVFYPSLRCCYHTPTSFSILNGQARSKRYMVISTIWASLTAVATETGDICGPTRVSRAENWRRSGPSAHRLGEKPENNRSRRWPESDRECKERYEAQN